MVNAVPAQPTYLSFDDAEEFFADASIDLEIPDYACVDLNPGFENITEEGDTSVSYKVVYTNDDEIDDFMDELETAGWINYYADDETYNFAAPSGLARMAIYNYLEEDDGYVGFEFFVANPYPAAALAADLAAYTFLTDSVPAFNGTAYDFTYSQGGLAYMATVMQGQEQAAVDSFADALTTAGYTVFEEDSYGDKSYESPNKQICVSPYSFGEGYGLVYVGIDVKIPFPSADIAADLFNSFGITDEVPAYSHYDVLQYQYVADDHQLGAALYSASYAKAAVVNYQADLLAAGYTYTRTDNYGDKWFVSPNKQVEVCAWYSGQWMVLDFSSWMYPADEVAEALADLGVNDELPEYAGEIAGAYYFDSDDLMIYVNVGEGNEEAALDAYRAQLVAAGYEAEEPDEYGDIPFMSPNDEMEVEPWIWPDEEDGYPGYLIIQVLDTFTPIPFPSAKIAADLAAQGVTLDLNVPAYTGEVLGYNYVENGHQLQVLVEEGTEQAAAEAYIAILLTAGYKDNGTDAYGDPHFLSPNEEMDVGVWYYPSQYPGKFYVDFTSLVTPWTAETAAKEVCSHFGKTPTDYSTQAGVPYYYWKGAYAAASYSASYIKQLLEAWLPSRFVQYQDWTAGHATSGGYQGSEYDYEEAIYLFNNGQVVLKYRVSTQDYGGTEATVIEITTYEPQA